MADPTFKGRGGSGPGFAVSKDSLDTERVRYVFRSPAAVLASTIAAFLIAYLGAEHAGQDVALAWIAAVSVVAGARLLLWDRARRRRITNANYRFWLLLLEIGAIASAILWSVPALLLFTGPVPAEVLAFYTASLAALMAGAVFTFAIWRRVFLSYVLLITLPTAAVMVTSGNELALIIGLAGLPYMMAVVAWGRVVGGSLIEGINLRLENYALASDLAIVRERARELDRTRHEGFASLSHELRTPLNAIIGFGQAMEAELWGPIGSARYKEYARNIVHAGEHLDILIQEAMDLSRLETGRITLEESDASLDEMAATCESLVAERARAKGQTLTVSVEPGLPPVYCDPSKVRQIVINLLSNAVKFTPQDGRIALRIERVSDGGVEIAVSDTGYGIPPEELKRVMEPFVRGDHAKIRAEEGLGLGLALSRTLAELHGGTLTLTSTLGDGTTAHLYLPRERLKD